LVTSITDDDDDDDDDDDNNNNNNNNMFSFTNQRCLRPITNSAAGIGATDIKEQMKTLGTDSIVPYLLHRDKIHGQV
jgi:hypothetical protein